MPRRSYLLTVLALTAALAAPGIIAAGGAPASAAPAPSASPTSSPKPAPPTNLVATRVTTKSVTLSWTASVPGCCPVTGYQVLYERAFDDIRRAVSVGNVTSTTITVDIIPLMEYNFRLFATDAEGNTSLWGNTIKVITPVADTGPDTVPPSTPGTLRSSGIGPAGVELAWSPSADNVGVTGYNVYAFDGWFGSRLVATVTGTSFTAPVLSSRDSYYVRARDAAGNISIATNTVPAGTASSPPPVSSPPPPPKPTCKVTYRTTSEAFRAFVASVTVANIGPAAVEGWTLQFSFGGDQKITTSWSGSFSQAGAAVTVKNASWNGSIPAGGSTAFGLYGSWRTSNAPPTAFTLNGTTCAVG